MAAVIQIWCPYRIADLAHVRYRSFLRFVERGLLWHMSGYRSFTIELDLEILSSIVLAQFSL